MLARNASNSTCGSTRASDVTVRPLAEITVPLASTRRSCGWPSRSPCFTLSETTSSTLTTESA